MRAGTWGTKWIGLCVLACALACGSSSAEELFVDQRQEISEDLLLAAVTCRQGSRTGRPIQKFEHVVCLTGTLTESDSIRLDLFEGVTIVVLDTTGGLVEKFLEFGELSLRYDLTFLVTDKCLSACAAVVLPMVDELVVFDGAFVALHGYFISEVSKYEDHIIQRGARDWFFDNIAGADEDKWKLFVEAVFKENIEIRSRLAKTFEAHGVSRNLYDFFFRPPPCFANDSMKQSWDYFTVVDKAFYSNYRSTDNWVWGEPISPSRFEQVIDPKNHDKYCFDLVSH